MAMAIPTERRHSMSCASLSFMSFHGIATQQQLRWLNGKSLVGPFSIRLGAQSASEAEEWLLQQEIRCHRRDNHKKNVLGKGVNPRCRMTIQEQLLPDIEGIRQHSDKDNRAPIQEHSNE